MSPGTKGQRRLLPFAPEVRPQQPARDGARCGMVDPHRQGGAAIVPTIGGNIVQRAVDTTFADLTSDGDGFDRVARGQVGLHTSKFHTNCGKSKRQISTFCKVAKNVKTDQTSSMGNPKKVHPHDVWPERFYVLGLIDAEIESGVPIQELVDAFGLKTPSSILKAWRTDYKRRPHTNTLIKIAERYKLQLKDVYNPIPLSEVDELAKANEFVLTAMGQEIYEKLNDIQKLSAYRVAVASAKAVLAT